MSHILRFLDRNVTVRRLRSSGSVQSYQATATADCTIQEVGGEARSLLGELVTGRAWMAYFEVDEDIDEGDKLTDSNGVDYFVREVTKKDYGTNQHLEVLLDELNA